VRTPLGKAFIVGVLALVLAAGCGSSSSSNGATSGQASAGATQTSGTGTTSFAKTKFLLHAGLAFGAIHRYIYKPYKEGKFSGGLFHHKLAVVKAALAAAFAYHEIRLALDDARSSKILSALLHPLLVLQTKLSSLRDGLAHGSVDPAAIASTNSDAGSIGALSSRAGQTVQDLATPSLGG
jgi:hypothetical protein